MTDKTGTFNNATARLQSDTMMNRMQRRITLHAGGNSVIDNAHLPHLDANKSVVLTKGVYETLKMIADATNSRGFEVPFLLFGDYNDGVFVFDDIDADVSAGDDPYSVSFSHELQQKILDFGLGAVRADNKVVAHGHSHPRVGPGYLNFSLGDMDGYAKMREKTWLQNVLFCGCLLTGGNFNFVFCDGADVYRIDNVLVENENGGFLTLPCFGPDVLRMQQNRGIIR